MWVSDVLERGDVVDVVTCRRRWGLDAGVEGWGRSLPVAAKVRSIPCWRWL